jgi:hypothetical protein
MQPVMTQGPVKSAAARPTRRLAEVPYPLRQNPNAQNQNQPGPPGRMFIDSRLLLALLARSSP